MYKNIPIKKYLDDLSSNKPAPGGGSATALVGALGVSCLSMVANFTIGKEKYKSHEKDIKKILKRLKNLRKRLLELVDLDVRAYSAVVKARKKSKSEKKKARKFAISVPKEVCNLCYEALKISPVLVEKGNIYLLSDVEVGVELLEAAFKSGIVNIKINL